MDPQPFGVNGLLAAEMYMFHRLLSLVTMMYNEQDQLTMCRLDLFEVLEGVLAALGRRSRLSEATSCGLSSGVRSSGIAANAARWTLRLETEVPHLFLHTNRVG